MPDPQLDGGPNTRDVLAACMKDVSAARARLSAARHVGVRRAEEHPLRADLLAALEGYAATITRIGAPIPPRLRTEIDLYRRLDGRD